jgi:molybdopterin-containing oxidoreductase family iron-sulfur binding subunit
MPELDRREFLKLLSVTAGAAATSGCSEPVEKLIPYVVQPEEVTPGIPTFYASTCRECPAACGLHVKTREGRPIKLEGNPQHPVNRGALCARGQASIGRTYHPDRYAGPLKRNEAGRLESLAWDEGIRLLAEGVREAEGSAWLLGADVGPTANRWIDRWITAVGAAGRVVYEPFAPEALRQAAGIVFGVDQEPVFDLARADLIVDFGSDFLEAGPSPAEHARQLAEARDVSDAGKRSVRFVSIGPRLSMTASSADEWIAAKPGTEGIVALAVAKVALQHGAGSPELVEALRTWLDGVDVEQAAAQAGVAVSVIERLGEAMARAHAPVALPPGVALRSRRATATAGAVLVLDAISGALGNTVRFLPPSQAPSRRASYRELLALIGAMKSGKVRALLIHDANPLYSLPASSGFAEALSEVPFVVSFASAADETSERANLILPDHTPLESWGDANPRPGVRSLLQPTVRPLHDTRALLDTLLEAGRAVGEKAAAQLPSKSFRFLLEEAWSQTDFRAALARGGAFEPEVPPADASLAPGAVKLEVVEPLLEGEGDFALLAFPSPLLHDGRGANLPWLQEIPDPVTKIAWQSWAEVSRETARRLGVSLGDVVAVETTAGNLELPVLPRGGIRDDVVAVPIGQGHTVGYYASRAGEGRPGEPRGVNVIDALPAATDEAGGRAWLATKASVQPTGGHRRLAFVQQSQDKRKRRLGESVSLLALAEHADGGAQLPGREDAEQHDEAHGGGEHHELLKPYDASKDSDPANAYRWGMSIDLDRCTGCSACVAACYIENNVPVVGERQTLIARQMAWIRIERWIGEGEIKGGKDLPIIPEEVPGAVDVRHSPMLCQQCGAAPCESVCPVLATYHNPEGLNGMVYNRCVGTRYCSNNCPYKVRRFNYYDYSGENWPGLLGLMLNPDVTVRGRGVMEKCSFCVQRIAAARQVAKNDGRDIHDGEVTPACAQSCPSQAITFGNLRDANSRVVRQGDSPVRGYHALHELNTRPAVTYLAKVRRGAVEGEE